MTRATGWLLLAAALRPADANEFAGTWRGTSKCVVRPSSCNDEDSVYRIAAVPKASDRFTVSANKIVDGREVEIGITECAIVRSDRALRCALPNGASVQFTVTGDAIDGRFHLADGTLWRRISLTRSR